MPPPFPGLWRIRLPKKERPWISVDKSHNRHEHLKFIQEYRETVRNAEDNTIKELQAMRAELRNIKTNSDRIPKVQYVGSDGKLFEIGPNSTIVRELPKS
ncbi:hypothetical protein DYBT9623_00697 [Dyadobacter sp. CECT 9623]|uniref:Uncharacterized protein n=1 Tax=Dyadobacter linearis TaxID=2823330 RepID=A0ABM8UKI2_9BACT|nr:hypothetical protein DYBT9623_00697 [Dyadobacter sp. CECT 9623]